MVDLPYVLFMYAKLSCLSPRYYSGISLLWQTGDGLRTAYITMQYVQVSNSALLALMHPSG